MVRPTDNKAKSVETKSFLPTDDDFKIWFYLILEQVGGSISIDETVPLPKKLIIEFTRCGDKVTATIPVKCVRKPKKKTNLFLPDRKLITPYSKE